MGVRRLRGDDKIRDRVIKGGGRGRGRERMMPVHHPSSNPTLVLVPSYKHIIYIHKPTPYTPQSSASAPTVAIGECN